MSRGQSAQRKRAAPCGEARCVDCDLPSTIHLRRNWSGCPAFCCNHFREDDLTPMERRLIHAVRTGLIVEALKEITAISEMDNQPPVTSR